jgi:hypothetical protein
VSLGQIEGSNTNLSVNMQLRDEPHAIAGLDHFFAALGVHREIHLLQARVLGLARGIAFGS